MRLRIFSSVDLARPVAADSPQHFPLADLESHVRSAQKVFVPEPGRWAACHGAEPASPLIQVVAECAGTATGRLGRMR